MFNVFFMLFCLPGIGIWMISSFPAYRRYRRGEEIGFWLMPMYFGWLPTIAIGALATSIYLNASSQDSFVATVQDVEEICDRFCLDSADKIVASTEDGGRYQFAVKNSGVNEGDRIEVTTRQDPMQLATEVVGVSVQTEDQHTGDRSSPAKEPVIDALPIGVEQ